MKDKQFEINAWNHQPQKNHNNQQSYIKNFVQFIDKANYESFRLKSINTQMKEGKARPLVREEKAFLSVNVSKRPVKTEVARGKLKSFVPDLKESTSQKSKNVIKTQITPQNKVKPMYCNNILTLAQKAHYNQQKSVRFINYQASFSSLSPKQNKKRSYSTKTFIRKEFHRKDNNKKDVKSRKGQKYNKLDIGQKNMKTFADQDRVKRLKSFFFKTIERQKSKESLKGGQKNQMKVKSMLGKSNMKKRKLEELFRFKDWIDQPSIQRTINASKICKITLSPSPSSLRQYQEKRERVDFTKDQSRGNLLFLQHLQQHNHNTLL